MKRPHPRCAAGRQPPPRPQPLLGLRLEPVDLCGDRGVAPPGLPGPRHGGPVAGGGDVPRLARLLGPGVHRFEHRRGRSREFRHPHSIAPQLCRDSLAVLALGVVLRLANPAQAVAKRSRRDARLGPLQLRGGASEYPVPPAQAPKLFGLSVDRHAAAPVHPSARASSSNRAWAARGSR